MNKKSLLGDEEEELEKILGQKIAHLNQAIAKQKKKMKESNKNKDNEQVNKLYNGRKNKRKLMPDSMKFQNMYKNILKSDKDEDT